MSNRHQHPVLSISSGRRTAVALATAAAAAAAWGQGRVTVEVIPFAPGSSHSTAVALSPNGAVAAYDVMPDGALSWLRQGIGGLPESVPAPAQGTFSVRAINDRGELAGAINLGGGWMAATWNPVSGWQSMGPIGSTALALNNAGHVLTSDGTTLRLWRPSEGTSTFTGWSAWSGQAAMNEAGQVTAQIGFLPTQGGLWSAAGGAATVMPWAPAMVIPYAINGNGVVAGGSGTAAGVNRAPFLWQPGQAPFTIAPRAPDAQQADAVALNDALQVVIRSGLMAGTRWEIWSPQGGVTDLAALAGGGFALAGVNGITNHAQLLVSGTGAITGGTQRAAMITLHPDWQGGHGGWDDGQHWNWGGTGVAPSRLGPMHDVVIAPAGSVVVTGAVEGTARTLVVGGTPGRTAVFDLAGGRTTLVGTDPYQAVRLLAGGTLRGQGQLDTAGGFFVENGGRIDVAAGQRLGVAADGLGISRGVVRVQGPGAEFAFSGTFINNSAGRIDVSGGSVVFHQGLTNDGQILLQDAMLDMSGAGGGGWLDNRAGSQLALSFGSSTVSGVIVNQGLVVVSNGAQASFLHPVVNQGELRVSAGGAANFFGLVSGAGSITGTGSARFEGGLSVGASPGQVTVSPDAGFGAASVVLMELGGTVPGFGNGHHDKIVFEGAVALEGGALEVVWWDAFSGGAGDRFDLFDWDGGVNGNFGRLALPTLAEGLVWDSSDLYRGGTLSIAAVPEPGPWSLLLIGAATLLWLAPKRTLSRRTVLRP